MYFYETIMITFWCVNVINNRRRARGYALFVYMYLFYLLELSNFVQIRKITSIESTPRTLNIIFIPLAFINIYLTFVFIHRFFHVKITLLNQTSDEGEMRYAYRYRFVYEYLPFFVVWYQQFFKTLSEHFFFTFIVAMHNIILFVTVNRSYEMSPSWISS